MKENALKAVDVLGGEQERERVDVEQRRKPFKRRTWEDTQNTTAVNKDREHLRRIAEAVGGRAISDVAIKCNLLVIEPDKKDGKPHVFAFRFINPKTISKHAERKQERVNLLRLYAYLVQEKLFREPAALQVCVAELVPRLGGDFEQYDYYPDYFLSTPTGTQTNFGILSECRSKLFRRLSETLPRISVSNCTTA